MSVDRGLPRYKCHKEVRALKIARFSYRPDGGAILTPCEPGFDPIHVSAEYVDKHKPIAGGYYVLYEDGYESFSPAEPFEAGYMLIQS